MPTPRNRPAVSFPLVPLLFAGLLLVSLLASGCGLFDGRAEEGAAPQASGDEQSSENPDPLQDGLEPDGQSEDPADSASFEAAPDPPAGSTSGPGAAPADAPADVPDVSGSWSGQVSSEAGEEGRLQLTLDQQPGGALEGSMTWTIAGEEPVPFEGLTGRVYPDNQVELLWVNPVSEEDDEVELTGGFSEGPAGGSLSGEVVLIAGSGGDTTPGETAGDGADGVTFTATRLPE